MNKKIIYISMETKIREYHAKLLLAMYALGRGHDVVIGSKYPMNKRMAVMPPGIYAGTGVTKGLGGDLLKAQKHGHKAVSFDEEGLAYINPEVFSNTRIKEDTIKEISHFFTWGKRHSELVAKKAPSLTNYTAVGNMRFELLKKKYHSIYESAVDEIRKQYGDFILINTNLKVYNHLTGEKDLFKSLRETTFIQSSEDEEFYKDRYAHQRDIFNSYKSLVSMLARKIKPMNIVIRPHTSENKETWRALEDTNVFVDNTGGIIPWILASKAVIQKNCTTSTETVYLDRPVITYSIRHDPRFDNDITNNIGRVCATEAEVCDALDNPGWFEGQLQKDKEFLSGYVSNMGDGDNAADAILDICDNIELPQTSGFDYKDSASYYLTDKARKVLGPVIRAFSSQWKLRWQKFPSLHLNEITEDIGRFARTVSIPAESVKITKISEYLFHLTMRRV